MGQLFSGKAKFFVGRLSHSQPMAIIHFEASLKRKKAIFWTRRAVWLFWVLSNFLWFVGLENERDLLRKLMRNSQYPVRCDDSSCADYVVIPDVHDNSNERERDLLTACKRHLTYRFCLDIKTCHRTVPVSAR